MSNKTNSASSSLVPRLRFPEFEGSGKWLATVLGKIGNFTGGGTPSKNNIDYWNGDIPWASSSDLSEDSIYDINISKFITEDALKDSSTKLIPTDSILLVSRVGIGKLAITQEEITTSQDFTNFTPQKNKYYILGILSQGI